MTNRDDNSLLDAAIAHAKYCEEAARGTRNGAALIGFACLLLLLWAALHLSERVAM